MRIAYLKVSAQRQHRPLTEFVAKKIVEIGRRGIRDPHQISQTAIKALGLP